MSLRICFFAWEVTWAKILTLDQLKKGEWRIPNRCYLCKIEDETSDHILIHCLKARLLWQLIFALFGIQWVLNCSVREVLLSWHGSFIRGKRLGRFLCCVCFRLYGENGIGGLLTTLKAQIKQLKILSCIYFGIKLDRILRVVLYCC